ncbi:MAG: sugar transferase [Flavobacteriaceae bacterium]
MLSQRQKIIKRGFDFLFSVILLPLLLLPILLFSLVSLLVHYPQGGWFTQARIGKEGHSFRLYKIRTLKGKNHQDIIQIQEAGTPFGMWLRNTKLDELPQLFNVLKGDMSFVGPRPDVTGYADVLQGEDRIILSVRPGVTGPATLKYKNEDAILREQPNPLYYNDTVLWPDKVQINKEYIKNWSFQKDLQYLLQSVFL